jgi:SOCS box
LDHGANANCSYRSNLTPLHVLIFTVSENFTVSVNCDIQKRANFDFIKNILLLLLQHGLDCNLLSQHILQSICEMVQNVRTVATDILCIYELTLLVLQYGADPNVILNSKQVSGCMTAVSEALANGGNQRQLVAPVEVSNDGMRNSFRSNARNHVLFYYIMLITRKEFILANPDRNYTKIIYLFYYTMRHDALYSCLKMLHNLFIVQVPNKSTEPLVNLITHLYRRPRNLKEICRVKIYESLNRKLANNINRLNMPLAIKDYVLNFE